MGKEAKKEFNRRAFVSVFSGFSFVLVVLTGLALFSAPSCRIARDTSWAVWGHSKEQLAAVHVWFAVLFAIATVYHIYLNWTLIKKYFKSKTSEGIGFRTEWVAALLICLVVYGGTVRSAWPFSSLIEWKESYKNGVAAQTGQGWRVGRAGAPTKGGSGCRESGSCESEHQLQQGPRGSALNVGGAACAESGDCESQGQPESRRAPNAGQVSGAGRRGAQSQALNAPRRGMGQMTLSEFCNVEGIELRWAIGQLREEGVAAQGAITIREIADTAAIHPRELRDILQTQ